MICIFVLHNVYNIIENLLIMRDDCLFCTVKLFSSFTTAVTVLKGLSFVNNANT